MSVSTAISPDARARVVGTKVLFQNLRPLGLDFLPQRIAVLGVPQWSKLDNGEVDSAKKTILSVEEAGEAYGYGSDIYDMVKQLLPADGNGVGTIPITVYPIMQQVGGAPLLEPDSSGTITVAGTDPTTVEGQYIVHINGHSTDVITVPIGSTPTNVAALLEAAVDAVFDMPATANALAAVCEIDPKTSAPHNDEMRIEVEVLVDGGNTFAIVAPGAASQNLDVETPLSQMAEDWDTVLIYSGLISETAAMASIKAFGQNRWGSLINKPLVCFMGDRNTAIPSAGSGTDATAFLDNEIISLTSAPDCDNGPYEIAAAVAAQVAIVANENPAKDYGRRKLENLVPGSDLNQWDYAERDTALKRGNGSTVIRDGVINLSDTITTYHPNGQKDPAYRYVCDIMKLMNILYYLDQEFNQEKWDGAPLIPDGQATINRDAKRPKDAKGAIAGIIGNAALNALISDPDTAKASIVAAISSTNPKRLDTRFTVQLAGNTNIISIDFNFGFFFGSVAAV